MSWKENVREVVPYIAGEQPQDKTLIKLNTNENPYPPAPGVQKALGELADGRCADLRLYPDMDASPLVQALSDRYDCRPEEIFVGVGSDDVLSMCFLTFFNSGRPVLFPDITYSFYEVWAGLYRIPYEKVPLDRELRIRPEDYLRGNGGIIFPNPNAPTGVMLETDAVEEIVRSSPDSVVIIDEAYIDFGGTSVLPLIRQYDNLLVVQTFSKSRSMAGMRIGFAMGNEQLIRCLKDVKFSFNSYTMNLPSILCGAAAVRDDLYFRETCARIVRTRERFASSLASLGFVFCPPCGNFVFAAHPEYSGAELFRRLRERKILVRRWDGERVGEYLRITIGADAQMEQVTEALREILDEVR